MNGYYGKITQDFFEDSLTFANEYCAFGSHKKTIQGTLNESGLYEGEAESIPVREYTKEYIKSCRVYHFHDTSSTAKMKNRSRLDNSNYLLEDAANIASFLHRLRQEFPIEYSKIKLSIQAIAPYFHDFYLEPSGKENDETILLQWMHKNHEEPFSAQQLSDGTLRFICMATLFLQPSELTPGTIILDEPELGLHPAAIETLADIIKVTSRTTQIICSTQSVPFANQFEPKNFIVVDYKEGISYFRRLDVEETKDWLEEYTMGDIWNSNLIGGRPS